MRTIGNHGEESKLKERSSRINPGSLKVYFIVEDSVDGFDGHWREKCTLWTSSASTHK